MANSASSHKHTIVVDYDGTLVTHAWPDHGDWQPGAIEAMKNFHAAGFAIVLFSARLSPIDPFTFEERPPVEVMTEVDAVRRRLDAAGLTFITIWTLPGKPGGTVYIDDRAERYHERPGSWKALTQKVMMRCGTDEAFFPAYEERMMDGRGTRRD